MDTVWVDPERVWVDGVFKWSAMNESLEDSGANPVLTSKTDVTTGSVCKAELGEDTKGSGHLLQRPSSLGLLGLESGYVMRSLGLAVGVGCGVQDGAAADLGRRRLGDVGRRRHLLPYISLSMAGIFGPRSSLYVEYGDNRRLGAIKPKPDGDRLSAFPSLICGVLGRLRISIYGARLRQEGIVVWLGH